MEDLPQHLLPQLARYLISYGYHIVMQMGIVSDDPVAGFAEGQQVFFIRWYYVVMPFVHHVIVRIATFQQVAFKAAAKGYVLFGIDEDFHIQEVGYLGKMHNEQAFH